MNGGQLTTGTQRSDGELNSSGQLGDNNHPPTCASSQASTPIRNPDVRASLPTRMVYDAISKA